jgi:hypothetical protein
VRCWLRLLLDVMSMHEASWTNGSGGGPHVTVPARVGCLALHPSCSMHARADSAVLPLLPAGQQLASLQAQWLQLVEKNQAIDDACSRLEQQVAALRGAQQGQEQAAAPAANGNAAGAAEVGTVWNVPLQCAAAVLWVYPRQVLVIRGCYMPCGDAASVPLELCIALCASSSHPSACLPALQVDVANGHHAEAQQGQQDEQQQEQQAQPSSSQQQEGTAEGSNGAAAMEL